MHGTGTTGATVEEAHSLGVLVAVHGRFHALKAVLKTFPKTADALLSDHELARAASLVAEPVVGGDDDGRLGAFDVVAVAEAPLDATTVAVRLGVTSDEASDVVWDATTPTPTSSPTLLTLFKLTIVARGERVGILSFVAP